ncbi:leucine-rich repeat-containing protein 49 isoform X4 [Heterodontus francisci]|uniref:leucine-rich repeat-containing protein 49 isoform X4 n=1 Tax=Heterodontus francisci TaxID=7792 RepID=UPI00355B5D53
MSAAVSGQRARFQEQVEERPGRRWEPGKCCPASTGRGCSVTRNQVSESTASLSILMKNSFILWSLIPKGSCTTRLSIIPLSLHNTQSRMACSPVGSSTYLSRKPSCMHSKNSFSKINTCSLQLTVQASTVGDRLSQKQQVDCRLNKELLPSHNKVLNVDGDKHFLCKPDTMCHDDATHYYSDSMSRVTAGDMPSHVPLSVKCKSRQGSRSAVPPPSHSQGTLPYLPGDHVIFSEIASTPGIPVVCRTPEERAEHSDRLNLDRRNLTVCPILEGEQQLRLLNFQHNLITQIQHLSNLRRLIFLDLYNNRIEEISGLSSLKSLRVLMLGKNRIKNISNLESLTDLDVLDLHANQICRMENINHLTELRVLNLAGNFIVHVENMTGLHSLTELNLRRNRIESVRDADTLPRLQRFFLSFNNISRFEDIACLSDSLSLSEVTLDGNPIAQESWYKYTILRHMLQLRQLDMKKITEEERRMASVMARKEDDKKREIHKQAILKEKRRLAISNAARQWEIQQTVAIIKDTQQAQVKPLGTANNISILKPCHINECEHELWPNESSQLSSNRCIENEAAENNKQDFTKSEKSNSMRSPDGMLTCAVQGLSITESHLAELEGDTLHLYGFGALESLDRSWGVQTAGTVTTVSFMFIDFDEIVAVLPRLRIKFPNILHLKFQDTNLHKLQQFNALALGRRLDQLTVSSQGNPVVNFSLWKYYVLFRLNHFCLQKINDVEVTPMDIVMGERLFGILARVAASDLPQPRLLSLLGEIKKKQLHFILEGKGKKSGVTLEETKDSIKLGGETVGRAILNYSNKDITTEQFKETKMFCQVYVQGLVKDAALIDVKNESLQKLWPQIFIELVRDCVIQMSNKNSHMKLSLKNIMDQK